MSGRYSRAWVEIDLAAVVENARTAARVAGTRLLPMVKANAYGVGAVAVSNALEAVDPWGYGVATVEEGAELRAAGIVRPVVVFMPVQPAQFEEFDRFHLTPALGDVAAIREWTSRGARPFHLEIDTGMGRSGIRWDEIERARDVLDTPDLEGCYTHFHSAERRDGSTEQQTERFQRAVARLPRRPRLLHVANSAAALRDRRYAFDVIRPGGFLYGCSPGPGLAEPRPVASLRARVLAVRALAPGESVSYGALWTAREATRVATLGIGYADGVRRSLGLSGRGAVLLGGVRCPFVGAVTMDLTMVEIGDRPVTVGDIATLMGSAQGACITLDEYASSADELQREALTSLGPRLPRVYD
jgi:alanine racemase